ncbi:hypothetical protein Tco_1520677, partial [Tanacetum coccineum]
MPLTPDLSFTGLDEFLNKPVLENRKSDEEVYKRVNTVKDKNVNTVRPKAVVNTARPKVVVNAVKGNNVNAVKASAYLNYEEIDGGYVAFGGNPKGGKITRKCTIKTGNLDFENVYFVRELNGIGVNVDDSKLMLPGITYCSW